MSGEDVTPSVLPIPVQKALDVFRTQLGLEFHLWSLG